MNTESYFSPDYATARRRFRAAAERAGAFLDTLGWGLKGPNGKPLGIDIAVYKNGGGRSLRRTRRLLLHTSGVHGIEGFAGSAIQLALLEDLANSSGLRSELPKDAALVFVHIVNPYGMAYLRRVNENNVDLNRNFLGPDEEYTGMPAGYEILDPLFHPDRRTSRSYPGFAIRLAFKLIRHGSRRLQQAGAGGQYDLPHGLFYGGAKLETGPRLLLKWLGDQLPGVRRACCIDVHSGLGSMGEQYVILERNQGGAYHRHLEPRYSRELDNTGNDPSAVYQVRGGIDQGVPRALPAKAEVDFVTQEFGTVNGFRVLHTLSEENRMARFGNPRDLLHPARLAMRRSFAPSSESWKRSILEKGCRLFHDTAGYLFDFAAS